MKYFCISLCLFILAPWGIVLGGAPTADEREAAALVVRYFDALAQGDTVTIRSSLSEGLLKKRRSLLDAPAYASHLIQLYNGARFEIVGQMRLANDTIAVDARIVFAPQDALIRRFLVRKELRAGDAIPRYVIDEETAP